MKWLVIDLITKEVREFDSELSAMSYAKTIKSYKILKQNGD